MASANYVLLEKITVGAAGASSVTFNSIPQTGYTDLVVKVSARSSASAAYEALKVSYNGSTTSYTAKQIYGNGSSAVSNNYTDAWVGFMNAATSTSNTFSSTEVYIPNYTSSNNKSSSVDFAQEDNTTTAISGMLARLWSNTSAITSIGITPETGNFVQGSTFYLYGVAKLGTTPAIVPYATGGDTIMTDGTYWYHTFTSSGTFTPQKSLSCDYLVVAGGGGGGYSNNTRSGGGGGGAGGLRSTVTATGGGGSLESALSLASGTGYTVTIGAGGAGGIQSSNTVSTNGSNSVFSTITSTGGGRGANTFNNRTAAASGGSGGGGDGDGSSSGASGTANQGYAGGNGDPSGIYQTAGGGGGAGAVGGAGSSSSYVTGGGGNGVATSITGSSVTYAGGGGGGNRATFSPGSGGTGGGGSGGNSGNGVAGTANTGGGGGGAGNNFPTYYNGAAGGSGIVIVRYAV